VETVDLDAPNNGSSNSFVKSATRKKLLIGSIIFSISLIGILFILPFLYYLRINLTVKIYMILVGTSSICVCLPIMYICSNENLKMYAKNKLKKVMNEMLARSLGNMAIILVNFRSKHYLPNI
jgi:hypothetical protein